MYVTRINNRSSVELDPYATICTLGTHVNAWKTVKIRVRRGPHIAPVLAPERQFKAGLDVKLPRDRYPQREAVAPNQLTSYSESLSGYRL